MPKIYISNKYNQFNSKIFYQVALDRGYYTTDSIVRKLKSVTGKGDAKTRQLLNGTLSYNDIIAIGTAFEMTPKEFCDIFLHDCFKENESGRFVMMAEPKKK